MTLHAHAALAETRRARVIVIKCIVSSSDVHVLQASCTGNVQSSIQEVLQLKAPRVIKASFNRHNIKYEVIAWAGRRGKQCVSLECF